MVNRGNRVCCVLLALIIGMCWLGEAGAGMQDMHNVSSGSWRQLAEKKIFFGHQSVGDNIMLGAAEVLAENPDIQIHIRKSRDMVDFSSPVFGHASVGKNNSPISKMDDFVQLMDSGLGGLVDMAFLKFCFVDVDRTTDLEGLLAAYTERFSLLRKKFPDVVFVHFTVPLLRRNEVGFFAQVKKGLKKLSGKKTDGFFDDSNNIARNRYNRMLKAHYEGREPVFDIAGLEATAPDGTLIGFTADGRMNLALAPQYTEDGGHLNKTGRMFIAEQLLIFLAGQ